MAEFKVLIDDKEYTLEYTRDSVRQFEALGGSIQSMQEKIFTSIDNLFYVGLLKHHKGISYSLAKKIADEAVYEWGVSNIYPVLAERFTEILTHEGNISGDKKSFLVSEAIKPKK